MANKPKKGGLDTSKGRALLFDNRGAPPDDTPFANEAAEAPANSMSAVAPAVAPTAGAQQAARPKSTRVRTTVALEPETLAAMEDLRYAMRKAGMKASMSDVLEEAVATLVKLRTASR